MKKTKKSKKEITITDVYEDSRQAIIKKIDAYFNERLKEEANTPLAERKTGWDILVATRNNLIQAIKDNK